MYITVDGGNAMNSLKDLRQKYKEDAERYERLLSDLKKIRNYEAFVAANQSIIDQYNLLHSELRSSGIVLPEKKVETAALVGPVATPETKKESTELVGPIAPVEKVDEYSYRLKRGEIIQDLPINSKDEQIFTTPGMSRDEIAFSQGRLAGMKFADPTKIVDPIEAEIERRKAEYEAQKNATKPGAPVGEPSGGPEKKGEGQTTFEPIPVEELSDLAGEFVEENEKSKKKKPGNRKVKNRKKFDWSKFKTGFKEKIINPISKKILVLKGLVFSENLTNKSASYQAIYPMILALRATYKHRTLDVNLREIEAIDRLIASKSDLTLAEKKRLITKLAALHKSVEKHSKKTQTNAVNVNLEAVDELDEKTGLKR